ncbi:hypothetical protein ACFQX6_22320 [Streptosporangium lutulentum]
MNDRVERDNDRLLHKDEDDLNVPSQRADVTPGFEEQRRDDALLNQPNDLGDDRYEGRPADSLVASPVDDPRPGHDAPGRLDDDLNDRPGDVLDRESP